MTRLVRDRVSWLLYAQLGVFGFFLYGFGPVVPLLRDELGVSRTVAGLFGPALAVGAALGGVLFPYLVRRLGRDRALWTGLAGLALGVALLSLPATVPGTLAATVVAMTFGMIVVSGVPAALATHQGPASAAGISEANAAAAGMGLVTPLLIGAAVNAGLGWRVGLGGTIALVGVLAAAAALAGVRIPAGAPAAVAASAPGAPAPGRLPRRYWLAWGCLLTTGSVEVCLSLWASEQLRERVGMAPGAAAAGMSAVLAGMVIGRLAGGPAALRFGVRPLLLMALAGAGFGFGVFWVATVPWLAMTGLVLCGLSISVHIPLGMVLAIGASDGQPDLAMARNSYAMALGFGVAPLALGVLADRVGIWHAFLLAPAFLAVAATMVVALSLTARRSRAATPPVGARSSAVYAERPRGHGIKST
ncbi:MAG: MFS transporter [Micromonosporaceae bacterium]|nr:MFS transporter [Micromonosporaceae bacterium]